MTALPVPMLDLAWQHRQIADEVAAGFAHVLDTCGYVLGAPVDAFEREYAEYLGAGQVIGVGNGTDAIELALRAAGLREGDEVVIPANTFVATAEAVLRAGGRLRFADVRDDLLIDPESVRAALGPRVRAVIVVHLYGAVADVDALREVVGPDVLIIEDAAQAQGARLGGRAAGTLGDGAGTSFYPGKNLGAYGDAGAVMMPDAAGAARVQALRNHGGVRRYEHEVVGTNSRLDSLQAVVLSAKLRRLEEWNAERRRLAGRYSQLLAGTDAVLTPALPTGAEHVFHQYVVRVDERDRVFATLAGQGIGVGIHYPTPVHLLAPYRSSDHPEGSIPIAERDAARILSLPIYPGLSDDQQNAVVAALIGAV